MSYRGRASYNRAPNCASRNTKPYIVTFTKPKATSLKFLPYLSWHWLTSAGGTFISATYGTFQSDIPGTFVPDIGGTFVSDTPGTFESDTGGTFNPLLSTN